MPIVNLYQPNKKWGRVSSPNNHRVLSIQQKSITKNINTLNPQLISTQSLGQQTLDQYTQKQIKNIINGSQNSDSLQEYCQKSINTKPRKRRILSQNKQSQLNRQQLRNPLFQRAIKRRKSENCIGRPLKKGSTKYHANIRSQINEKNDYQLLQELCRKYLTETRSQKHENQYNLESIQKKMEQISKFKDSQIQVISIYKDQLCLITYLKYLNTIKQDKQKKQNKYKVSLKVLKQKNRIYQDLYNRHYRYEQCLKILDQQFDLYAKYLLHITEQQSKCWNTNSKQCWLDLKQQQSIIQNNIKNQIDYLSKQLQKTKNQNIKQIKKLQRNIMNLRVNIKNKQQKLKNMNQNIFHFYTRRNRRTSPKSVNNYVNTLHVLSSKQLSSDEFVQQQDSILSNQLNKQIQSQKRLKILCSLKYKQDNFPILKQIVFSKKDNKLYVQFVYELRKKNFNSKYFYIRQIQQGQLNFECIQSVQINEKLKSLVFYFSTQKHNFLGVEARYSNFTHSYDIGRESQSIRYGKCNQKAHKFQIVCKNKIFINANILINKSNSKFVGFTFKYKKRQIEPNQCIKQQKTVDRSQSLKSSSSGRLSIDSKCTKNKQKLEKQQKTKTLKKNKGLNKRNKQVGQAYTQYGLYD